MMIRVKVVYEKAQLVVPVSHDAEATVSSLVQLMNHRLQTYLGDRNIRVKELCTSDGFYLNPADRIAHVIAHDDVLVAKSYSAWIKDNLDLLNKPDHSVSRLDYATWPNPYYSVDIGKHKYNQLYIKIHTHKGDVHRLEVFDEEALSSWSKDGKQLVTQYKDDDKWFADVHFLVQREVVTGLEVRIKAASDKRPEIVYFPVDSKTLTVGEPKVLQTAAFPRPNKTYELPKDAKDGPAFDPKDFVPEDKEPSGIPKEDIEMSCEVVGTGNSGLEIKQKDPILADQSWYSEEEGGFDNMFLNNLSLFNPTDKEIAVVKITSEYEKDGQWIPTKIRCGDKGGYYRYSMYGPDPDEGFNMESNQRQNMAVLSSIFVKAPNYAKNRRAHHSLPNPLRIKISFITKEGTKSEIITEYQHKPLYLATRETFEAKKGHKTEFWVQADDVPAEARIFASVTRIKEKDDDRLEVSTHDGNRSVWLRKEGLAKYIYDATSEGKSEVELDCTVNETKPGYYVKAFGLVDVENQFMYGIRFELKTTSSFVTESYLFPADW